MATNDDKNEFVVGALACNDEIVGVWTETTHDDKRQPRLFSSREDAQNAIDKFAAESEEAFKRGDVRSIMTSDDFAVFEASDPAIRDLIIESFPEYEAVQSLDDLPDPNAPSA
ncbi:hypothetical protein NBRC3280_2838 [Acetobacter pasteurianus NBRC 3280]|uniref:Uncharacterized protein n=1 Tax=Acetobacter pasteurianus NBRC 3278 TaxID=1226660 RepID=A0A401X8I5_ACEPA|nr:hypothetical protein [Acetobacter pasteurianus]GCD60183.1 hypothetical protein NBRC3277_2758 [Acetobacter pasteurianus NBRC 3277]GCD64215.1 hypothetical protein NBRC3278_3308 [Acetobacter pasteurianus NBRC 3278]GCD70203.1 hypothetical protein NBRC3280_2838 [Acetobacter pasteurianus NBRC 3280]